MKRITRTPLAADRVRRSLKDSVLGLLALCVAAALLINPISASATPVEPEAASSAMPHDMDAMADPCCDECADQQRAPCDNPARCATVCGKLLLQAWTAFEPIAVLPVANAGCLHDSVLAGELPTPLRRPPRVV